MKREGKWTYASPEALLNQRIRRANTLLPAKWKKAFDEAAVRFHRNHNPCVVNVTKGFLKGNKEARYKSRRKLWEKNRRLGYVHTAVIVPMGSFPGIFAPNVI